MTYSSKCFLLQETCDSKEFVKMIHKGICQQGVEVDDNPQCVGCPDRGTAQYQTLQQASKVATIGITNMLSPSNYMALDSIRKFEKKVN